MTAASVVPSLGLARVSLGGHFCGVRLSCEFSRVTVGSAGTHQLAAAARRSQARGRARPYAGKVGYSRRL